MADMPSDFWSGWVMLLFVFGFIGLAWLVLSVYFLPTAPDDHVEAGAEEPVWDGNLREGNNPAPFWWFWLLLAAMVFSVVYLMLYPGFGSYAGAFKWSQGGQLRDHQQEFIAEFAAVRGELLAQSLPELAADPRAMDTAAGLFRENCAACHGARATGQANLFPNLRDGDWQWGGTPEQIEQTIRHGRTAMMPSWQAVLNDEGVRNVAGYVQTLATGAVENHPGQGQYMQLCVGCHGPTGDGNPLLGAPRLNDDIWLYGGSAAAVSQTLSQGRGGQMPAFGQRLDDLQIKLLVAWLARP
ncbi:MAG: cytochrome-c oxidase, cbb3-type subunit III [Gammaproteobacteria bacterium]|nr:cytochrome-c oxidase, cbb3-type subunit III [Gammaproteobacteria bacterium]MBK8131677.1 cytochrome-c oxidase, cbb3-type subunit III [Gammaproteobacteria bacterium]MBK9428037.1 cytochrome-c oxidase, cbb3-type subunit III [Gammaproteobacteria bacterium]